MDLIQPLMNQLQGQAISQIGKMLGEGEAGTKSALTAAIPSLLASLLGGAKTSAGANSLLSAIQSLDQQGKLASSLGDIAGAAPSQSSDLLSSLLGAKLPQIASTIARISGISESSVRSLLALCLPLILGTINRALKGQGDAKSALMNLAASQLGSLKSFLPGNLASELGISDAVSGATKFASNFGSKIPEPRRSSFGAFPALLLLAALLAGWWLYRNANRPNLDQYAREVQQKAEQLGSAVQQEAQDQAARARADLQALVDDASRSAAEAAAKGSSFAARFGELVSNASLTSVAFQNVNFESGTARLTTDSDAEIGDLAAALSSSPNVAVRIIGYTDNVGDPMSNVQLSAARANAVKERLVQYNISGNRIWTEGRGEANPVADNSTEEGRARNRRVEVAINR